MSEQTVRPKSSVKNKKVTVMQMESQPLGHHHFFPEYILWAQERNICPLLEDFALTTAELSLFPLGLLLPLAQREGCP